MGLHSPHAPGAARAKRELADARAAASAQWLAARTGGGDQAEGDGSGPSPRL